MIKIQVQPSKPLTDEDRERATRNAQDLERLAERYPSGIRRWCLHRLADLMRWCAGFDSCEICHGREGGTPGNENRIEVKPGDMVVMCDYCHAAWVDNGRPADVR